MKAMIRRHNKLTALVLSGILALGTLLIAVPITAAAVENSAAVIVPTAEAAVETAIQPLEADPNPPQNITINIGKDETQRNFTWYSKSALSGEVQLAKAADMTGSDFPVKHQTFAADRTTSSLSGFATFKATVTGLLASTDYIYRVGRDEGFSDIYDLKLQSFGGNFSFLAAGDPQIGSSGNVGNDTTGWTTTLDKAVQWFPGVSFLITLGDQVETAATETQYDGFLKPDVLRSMTFAPNVGNHDRSSAIYKQHFTVPHAAALTGDTAAGGDYWYSYNGVLFMSINSNNTSTSQHKSFLKDAIASYKSQNSGADPLWKIVTFHHSTYSSATHVTNTEIVTKRNELPPVFKELKIDAVLMGHDHVYTRSYVMNGTTPITAVSSDGYTADGPNVTAEYTVDPAKNTGGNYQTVYITVNSASGSKFYANVNSGSPWVAASNQENRPNITKIDVAGNRLTFTTYRTGTDNTVKDVVDTFKMNRAADPYGDKDKNQIVNSKDGSGNGNENQIVNISAAASNTTVDKIADKAYTGKQIAPAPVIKLNGKALTTGTDYTTAYKNNIKIGKATVTLTGKGKYTGTKTIYFKIVPTKTSITKAVIGSKQIKITWKKVSSAQKITKYQIRYKLKGAKNWTKKTVPAKSKSFTAKKLKKGKTYQIQVRSYKTVSKVKYYSAWSAVKTTKKIK